MTTDGDEPLSEWESEALRARTPKVCGLPLVGLPVQDTPLAAVVIVKVLDDEGHVGYYCRATDGVSTVEALGMAAFADVTLRQVLAGEEW